MWESVQAKKTSDKKQAKKTIENMEKSGIICMNMVKQTQMILLIL